MQFELPFDKPKTTRAPIRRRVYRVRLEPFEDGTYLFKARSFSISKGKIHRCRVNPETGMVSCTCADFYYRKSQLHPTYYGGDVCKHLKRAIRTIHKVDRDEHHTVREAA
jgi:hypothetical protein